jgi:hypothetical protein
LTVDTRRVIGRYSTISAVFGLRSGDFGVLTVIRPMRRQSITVRSGKEVKGYGQAVARAKSRRFVAHAKILGVRAHNAPFCVLNHAPLNVRTRFPRVCFAKR